MPQQHQSKNKFLPWFGWFIACSAGLYQFLLQTSSSVMISDLEKSFSLDSFGVSLLSSSFFYTYLICQIPAGILIDRFKPRRTIFICQFLLSLFCFMFAVSTHVWMAGASRILMGIVCAPTFIIAFYLIARTLPEKFFALVAGFTETMAMLGGVAGEALLARSVAMYGWRSTVMILAGVALAMSVLAWLTIRDDVSNDALISRTDGQQANVLRDLAAMLSMPQAWINGLFCGLLFGLIASFGAFWCIPFLVQLFAISVGQAADMSSMIFIGAACGTPTIGWLSDRLGTRRILMMLCTILALITFILIVFVPNIPKNWMFAFIFLLGFFSAVYLLPFAVIRDITPAHMRGTAMGFINMMCILIGSPVLLPLIGWLLHSHAVINSQAYQHALLVIPVCLLTAFGLAFFVKEEAGK
jgi:MFS family permease